MSKCERCGNEFEPEYSELFKRFSKFCETCQCRNFMDGLGLPTHPAMLDKHTKHPTLTESEYRKELHKD